MLEIGNIHAHTCTHTQFELLKQPNECIAYFSVSLYYGASFKEFGNMTSCEARIDLFI